MYILLALTTGRFDTLWLHLKDFTKSIFWYYGSTRRFEFNKLKERYTFTKEEMQMAHHKLKDVSKEAKETTMKLTKELHKVHRHNGPHLLALRLQGYTDQMIKY
jgi:hypothetical protein